MIARSFWSSLVLLLVAACDAESTPATQATVSIFAEASVTSQLDRLDVQLYPVDATAATPATEVRSFALARTTPQPGQVRLPLSFGVAKKTSNYFLLVVSAYGDLFSGSAPLIEHKQIVAFVDEQSISVSVTLTQACLGKATVCAGLRSTCYAEASGQIAAGQCGPVDSSATSGTPDAGLDAAISIDARVMDAAPRDDTAADAGDGGPGKLPLPPERTCNFANSCLPDYPCVLSTTSGYTCRGQFAEWPMPGRAPGSKFAPSYALDGPGVVLDQVTGLRWQQSLPATYPGCTDSAGSTCSWKEAKAYCAQLDLAGIRWRLPSKIELESLFDETRFAPTSANPAAIDPTYFPGAPADQFWTASQAAFSADPVAYGVSFSGGYTQAYDDRKLYKARCVNSVFRLAGTPDDRYRIEPDGTVADLRTQLTWQRTPSEEQLDSAGAEAHCQALGNGFRLPTIKELSTLHDPTVVRIPAVPAVFYPVELVDRKATARWYWTTSRWPLTAMDYYIGNLDTGIHGVLPAALETCAGADVNCAFRAWCVR